LESISHEGAAEQMEELYEQHGISSERIANVVAFAIDQPDDTNVNEFTVGPTTQPW
jgi:NADP-dependent 3-hydroxy acid dehydrogenase YdfG